MKTTAVGEAAVINQTEKKTFKGRGQFHSPRETNEVQCYLKAKLANRFIEPTLAADIS